MIRNDSEYQEALRRLAGGEKSLADYRAKLKADGLAPEEVEYALGPSASFALDVREEVARYERAKRGDLDPIVNLHGLGPLLIAARIAVGVTQRQLAERLEVHESQVSRDERNEYHGVTAERASKILDVLGVKLTSAFQRAPAAALAAEPAPGGPGAAAPRPRDAPQPTPKKYKPQRVRTRR